MSGTQWHLVEPSIPLPRGELKVKGYVICQLKVPSQNVFEKGVEEGCTLIGVEPMAHLIFHKPLLTLVIHLAQHPAPPMCVISKNQIWQNGRKSASWGLFRKTQLKRGTGLENEPLCSCLCSEHFPSLRVHWTS